MTEFRIGKVLYVSQPGEAFPEVSAGIRAAITGADAVHMVGMAQDQLGYYFPPEEAPGDSLFIVESGKVTLGRTAATTVGNDSDHLIYNTSLTLGDLTVQHSGLLAQQLGFTYTPTHVGPMQDDPNALSKPGVQFFPVIPQSVDPSVRFQGYANKASDGAALGAAFGGALAVTTSSGPGTPGTTSSRARSPISSIARW